MLDTNILIYLIRNKPPAVAVRINALAEEDMMCMSFIMVTNYMGEFSRVQGLRIENWAE